MLIALYFFIIKVALPNIVRFLGDLVSIAMPVIIILAGIVILLGAVGMKVSENLGSTIMNGIFRGIDNLCRAMFRGIRWFVLTIARLLPRVYRGTRASLRGMGLSPVLSNIFAMLVTVLVLVIII